MEKEQIEELKKKAQPPKFLESWVNDVTAEHDPSGEKEYSEKEVENILYEYRDKILRPMEDHCNDLKNLISAYEIAGKGLVAQNNKLSENLDNK